MSLRVKPMVPNNKHSSFYNKIASCPIRFTSRRKGMEDVASRKAIDPFAVKRVPKVRVCYVCGREYGLSSFEIHLKQCKQLFIAQEERKPLRERKPLPEPPNELVEITDATVLYKLSPEELEAQNRAAAKTFENKVMEKCAFCGRTFNPERLAIHNRSCTAERPARAVGTARLSPSPSPVSDPSPQKPKKPSSPSPTESTSSGRPSLSSSQGRPSISSSYDRPSLSSSQGRPSLSSSQGRLSSSRLSSSRPSTPPETRARATTPPSRTTTPRASTSVKLPALSTKRTPATPAQLAEFQAKLDFWEGQALAMVQDIRAMKDMLAQLSTSA
ncbi:hypothetical protein THRCLA_02977 [Thraustotheca clavata]|uniref:C2HC/C3H-type domain-containing protein n=1 Tax=Thraustotheca clavata TaxID=74557 RepID=A0A1W0A3F6_9STRA|nr:hypothetical protein THRCLA_02977 [Thraustotheca clavata]